MPYSTGIEAYRWHNQLFMQTTTRAYKGPWRTFGTRVFDSLRKKNLVLHTFISRLIARNFGEYDFEVLVLGLAIFLESLPGVPEMSGVSLEAPTLEASSDQTVAVRADFFEDGLEGAFNAFTDFIKGVCAANTLLARKMVSTGRIVAAVIIYHNEHAQVA